MIIFNTTLNTIAGLVEACGDDKEQIENVLFASAHLQDHITIESVEIVDVTTNMIEVTAFEEPTVEDVEDLTSLAWLRFKFRL